MTVRNCINPCVTIGHSHSYHLDESTNFYGQQEKVFIFIYVFDKIPVSKQYSPRGLVWDNTTSRLGQYYVSSGAILRLFWGNTKSLLGQYYVSSGAILRLVWGNTTSRLGQYYVSSEAILRLVWGNTTSRLGQYYVSSGAILRLV